LRGFIFCKRKVDLNGSIVGTETYNAVEIFSGSEQYGFEVDIWAFGVLFFFMLNMEFPFSNCFTIQNSTRTGHSRIRKPS
jgi:serine/threonine protein kinase